MILKNFAINFIIIKRYQLKPSRHMKKLSGFIVTLLVTLSLTMAGIQDVEAKRFGGARSFGSRPAYSNPYRRSTAAPTRSASQQRAYAQNQAARQALSRRGGLWGMLGGLALGGLLGSLFFGGAFEGLNFMDILVFGGIAYLLFRLFASRSRPARSDSYERTAYGDEPPVDYENKYQHRTGSGEPAGFDTDVLFNKAKKRHDNEANELPDAEFDDTNVPDDFDQAAFLQGAKTTFKHLQAAWDNKDLAEIRGLTTDKVFAEIQQQIKADPGENHTEVLRVDAELLDYREIGSQLETVVLFDTILREENNGRAEQVREVWHFIKPKQSHQPTWYLDGIQQLAD